MAEDQMVRSEVQCTLDLFASSDKLDLVDLYMISFGARVKKECSTFAIRVRCIAIVDKTCGALESALSLLHCGCSELYPVALYSPVSAMYPMLIAVSIT